MKVRTADVVVIGGGIVGAASARAIARRGISVALLEQGSLTTAPGSSRGTARIVAPTAYPDMSYLHMGLRALEAWRALESASGASFLELNGALLVGDAIEGFAAALDDAGVASERVAADTVAERFGISGLPAGPVLYQLEAGVIRADHARDALLRSAVELGAEMHQHERVITIDAGNREVALTTALRSWTCTRVVVTAGPWTRDLVRELGIELPLLVSSQAVAYFRPPARAAALPALVEFGDGDEPYSLLDPTRGLKAALHRRGPEVDPNQPWELVDTEALRRIKAWVGSRFPAIDTEPTRVEACLYTNSPDERFVLRREGPIVFGSACNGQGFQFAPETGESLARLALDESGDRAQTG